MRIKLGDGMIYQLTECVMKLAMLNILWIFFFIIGFGVFGLFPATIALFSVARKWIKRESSGSLFNSFWSVYKLEFIRGNLFGLFFMVMGYVLYVDVRFFRAEESFIMLSFSIILLCVYAIVLLYFFPVYVHYDLKFLQYLKQSLFISVIYPLRTLLMGLGMTGVGSLLVFFPGLIPFFSISLVALVLMYISNTTFMKLEEMK
ncbi:YesL family protein [Pseudalkalibacillus hwajinpoensis]|uniref:YesL family protein n=1 Tax=Guptibacillus hwajinpoensis TaxID=208199 RepID=UPI001CD3D7B0|nr:DUF624 domain-containing protein [Pseudalkalibacillus hwajinpoensis]MCA0991352.1 DUF624 domain-containing protein [Pseudalkalibacillus hwajinpoensis]